MQRSAWRATRSSPRTRSGFKPRLFMSRPNSRSTAPRPRYRSPKRLLSRGISGCRREALRQTEAGWHSPVGQRHLVSFRLKSAPANAQVPCSHSGGRCSPRFTAGVLRRGMIGRAPTRSHAVGRRARRRSPCRASPSQAARARGHAGKGRRRGSTRVRGPFQHATRREARCGRTQPCAACTRRSPHPSSLTRLSGAPKRRPDRRTWCAPGRP